MADTTLAAIRTKVRRLTRSPSTAQITNAEIDEYINTFVLYDFPEHLRLFSLRQTLTFFLEPNVDTYDTTTAPNTDPLFDFINRYITIHEPIYIGGYQVFFSQSREQFFGIYPLTNSILSVGTGDGVTTQFTGTLTEFPILQNQVTFTSIDANNNGLVMSDVPYSNSNGNLVVPDVAAIGVIDPNNDINYITGVFTVTFGTPPAAGTAVESQVLPYVAARPNGILFFNNTFTVRPVPDKPYRVNMEVYIRPTELLQATASPELEQWWQYISYGAAKKVFEDRSDLEGVQLIMPKRRLDI